jgi:hypothetical protein
MKEFLREKIIGTWQLVSWVYTNDKGETTHYFGEDAKGILMYDTHGYMNAQLMRADRQRFSSESISSGTPTETHGAFHSYLAYFGRYLEVAPGELVHTVEGSLFPNWVGHKEVRYGKIERDLLILNTPPIPVAGENIVFHITWRRI